MRNARKPLVLLLSTIWLAACATQEDAPITEDPAVRSTVEGGTRSAVDTLAAQLGDTFQVQQQTWTDCRDSVSGAEVGEEFLHGVRVELGAQENVDQAVARLAADLEPRGWTVLGTSADGIRLARDGYRTGASIFSDHGYASVSGSAGCLGTAEDLPDRQEAER
ncbi:hypothetical protein [Litorihabitans aurantiacus]|uniref:Lipoprotein n=1 Tax=Litorihabitans aurantiacus TaxID=1930061 RepID=A0AA37XGH2_9MICO|nr:hypothetical protein [Litorihabitans aurantiacus]GMA33223.1 hypothetical protein GCM10025875_32150 [Litorihabitans aurantiacus]